MKTAHEQLNDITREKRVVLRILYSLALAIVLMGTGYTVYCLCQHVSLLVLNASMPGAVFGIVIAFLGIRYLFAVQKLSVSLRDPKNTFSWQNYRFRTKEPCVKK